MSIVVAVKEFAAKAAVGAVDRERGREEIGGLVPELLATGIGRLRVPASLGGADGSVASLGALLVEIAAADSNLVQIIRGHLGFVEFLRLTGASDELLAAAGRGEFFGPAASSKGTPTLIDGVRLHDGLLSGAKYYTTGSLYADWINVLVPAGEGFVEAVVRRDAPGVTIVDDWSGFGQKLTASGTTTFDAVPVDHVLPHSEPWVADYLGAFYQFIHSSTQAGITRRAADDIAALVRGRRRSYPLAVVPTPREDPQVLAVVGEVTSRAYATRATVLSLGAAFDAYQAGDASLESVAVESAAAQVTNTRLAGEAGWLLFDAASASALDVDLALDRHLRNARTVSSHNPVIYKARLVGEYVVNGSLPATRP